jgi:hypothetical protein
MKGEIIIPGKMHGKIYWVDCEPCANNTRHEVIASTGT